MFGLGTTEMIIILILVLIVFGAGKLPQAAASLGKGIRNFKDGLDPNLVEVDKPSARSEEKQA